MKIVHKSYNVISEYNGKVSSVWALWESVLGPKLEELKENVLKAVKEWKDIKMEYVSLLEKLNMSKWSIKDFKSDYFLWKEGNSSKCENSFDGHIEILKEGFYEKFISKSFPVEEILQQKIDEATNSYPEAIDVDVTITREEITNYNFKISSDNKGFIWNNEIIVDVIIKLK